MFDPWVGKIPLRKTRQPTSVFLLGDAHGQRSLAGCSPWGRRESDMIEQLSTQKQIKLQPYCAKSEGVSLFLKLFFFFWCGSFLKSLLNLLQYCFCFLFGFVGVFFGPEACGILPPWLGVRLLCPALEVYLHLDPWAAREVPVCRCLSSFILELNCLKCFLETGLPWVSITICLYLQTELQHLTQWFIIYFLFPLNFQLYQLIICLQVSGHWSADMLASFDSSSLWLQSIMNRETG